MTNEELKQHIAAFVRDYSIEITPHDAGKLDAIRAELAPGTAVYVAHPPGVPIDDIVTLAGQVQKLGLTATPHVIARKLESRDQLERALARCQELGIHNALCVAGDITADKPAYNSSLEVLQTGLFSKYGFRDVGVAGHLELHLDLRGIGGSALTSDTPVPLDRDLAATDIPSTYVPARNTIFLSLALGWEIGRAHV